MLNIKSIVAVMAMLPLGLLAQKDVVSAYNANRRRYLKAAEFIDMAILDAKANIEEKTWRYRGNIYTNIASDSALYAQVPDTLEKAVASFAKAEGSMSSSRYESERKADIARGATDCRKCRHQLLQRRCVRSGRGVVCDRIGNDPGARCCGHHGHLQQRPLA